MGSISIKLSSLLVLLLSFANFAFATTGAFTCAVCGMEIKPQARAAFESVKEKDAVHLCSYSCAHAFHAKYPETPLYAHDFLSGEKIDAKEAYFLIKSENVVKELEFGMTPMVVAFSKEEAAKKKKAQLKDGEVVKGYEKVSEILK